MHKPLKQRRKKNPGKEGKTLKGKYEQYEVLSVTLDFETQNCLP